MWLYDCFGGKSLPGQRMFNADEALAGFPAFSRTLAGRCSYYDASQLSERLYRRTFSPPQRGAELRP